MASPARSGPLHDETYLPGEDAAEIIDFLSARRDRGRRAAEPRPRLTGPDGRSVELPEPTVRVVTDTDAPPFGGGG
jgi:hypothetical protein